MLFHVDVAFVPDHAALKDKAPPTTHRVIVAATDTTDALLTACQMVAARGVLVLGSEIAG